MALFSMPAAADALDDLLDHERRMILSGKIEGLIRLAPEKERQLARLPGAVADRARLERLRAKVERNQALLAAAARGVRAVQMRLDALRAGPAPLRTYGRDGNSTALDKDNGGFNKRA